MKNLVTFWTVKYNALGMIKPGTKFFHEYENAKAASMQVYHDRAVKHTVKPENMPPECVFED